MKFKKEDLQELEYTEGFEIIETAMLDQQRWTTRYKVIFKYNDKFYVTFYRSGSTENCDERPYEFDPDEIECEEVFPTEVKILKYLTKKEINKL